MCTVPPEIMIERIINTCAEINLRRFKSVLYPDLQIAIYGWMMTIAKLTIRINRNGKCTENINENKYNKIMLSDEFVSNVCVKSWVVKYVERERDEPSFVNH